MSWQQGRDTIVLLIRRGHLEQISGDAANGGYLIQQARQRLTTATTLLNVDPVSAYTIAYDSARQAVTALLIQQGLRPKMEGGHVAIAEAVRAQFGEPFHFFNAMRRRRNKLEYPQSPSDVAIASDAAAEALDYVERTVRAAEQLLPTLRIWHP
ncbi:hypothetical protein MSM1_20335 [Mycobacterium sp. SM1]|uniref:hypothetical protein n=1 Tax=Mycobacterium sp. SM1 TaxID=2816243 RepID=UPI001BCBD759|nr:hypothetical protein [Mycobacterium sp. SM1]MBS4730567.1 hypothetical protein [Mycobacterium sp. SM1]